MTSFLNGTAVSIVDLACSSTILYFHFTFGRSNLEICMYRQEKEVKAAEKARERELLTRDYQATLVERARREEEVGRG